MENYNFDDSQSPKEKLLRKCRDTIQKMEIEIINEKNERIEAENQNAELINENLLIKQDYELLESKWQSFNLKHHEKIKETNSLEKKIIELNQHNQKLETLLENEQLKYENAEAELEKYSEFIQELQDELKTKQDALAE